LARSEYRPSAAPTISESTKKTSTSTRLVRTFRFLNMAIRNIWTPPPMQGWLFPSAAFETLADFYRTAAAPPFPDENPMSGLGPRAPKRPGPGLDQGRLFDQRHLGARHELLDIDQDEHAFAHRADACQILGRESRAELRRGTELRRLQH